MKLKSKLLLVLIVTIFGSTLVAFNASAVANDGPDACLARCTDSAIMCILTCYRDHDTPDD